MKSFVSLLALATAAQAVTFYTLDLRTPGDVNLTQFEGTIKVPEYPPGYPCDGCTYYLWPGLQGSSVPGVYQNVMSPESSGGTWSVDSGYCCESGQPFDGGLSGLEPGSEYYFNNLRGNDGTWTTQFAVSGKPVSQTDTFNYSAFPFNLAVFAIELYGASWNFGEFAFYDVTIAWLGDDTSACNNNLAEYNGGDFAYAVDGASATVRDGQVFCYFSQVLFEAPPPSS
ncbi:hypothetical protein BDY17DRAFT_327741 [Neohortaea acidophila]|uniref:Uncharacterized protein n=1 Tax=Neohortaea acidophila TaxID=245834 RepID=A0A6A6PID6_9PEZI|nr:uncharacterized protein BDY17DRAFT_327741 [Neohortaea acidophila]KAF2479808.1 hypothetical protein BDY17DRAFT_327741 [Neohortaea acidophila]